MSNVKFSSTTNKTQKCVLNCKNVTKLYSFPENWEAAKEWLKILQLDIPSNRSKTNSTYLCANHFSSRQLTNSRNIAPSFPDRNIPGKEDGTESDTEPNNITKNPTKSSQCTMIISKSSKCYLKCKTYKMLHKFPQDLPSYKVWIQKLGLPETSRLSRRATLCDNHFSPAMRGLKTITKCAVPDMYLPSQCTFIDELENASVKPVSLNGDGPTTSENIVSPPNNSNSVVNSLGHKNHSFTSSVASRAEVIFPENYKNGLFECVLKCKDSKTLYRFPNVESRRQLWLSQIGLTHCLCSTRICNRHFSEKMISNKRLTNTSFPDINLPLTEPLIKVASLPLQNQPPPEVQELPQYVCVLTVFTHNTKIKQLLANETKYLEYTTDKKVPKRERGIQVDFSESVQKVDVGVLADDDFSDEEDDIVENINFNEQQPKLVKNKPQVYISKSKDMFECLKCGEISLDEESNIKHLNLHNELNVLCFYCGRLFINSLKLKKHEKKMHSIEVKQLLRCPREHCHKAFHSRRYLDQHLDDHTLPTKHNCIHCGRLFFSSLKLHCHLLACRMRLRRSRIK